MSKYEPLTAAERRTLKSYGAEEGWGERISNVIFHFFMMGFIVFLAIGIMFVIISAFLPDEMTSHFRTLCLITWPILMIAVFVLLVRDEMRRWRSRPISTDNAFLEDLNGGVACVQRLSVVRAFELDDYEDEGLAFLLQLQTGGVLCLMDQDFYSYASDIELEEGEQDLRADFPQTVVEYRHGPNSGLALGYKGIGESLRPTHKIPGLQKMQRIDVAKRRRYVSPEHGTFYPGTLEDVCKSFGFAPQPISDSEQITEPSALASGC